MHSRNDVIGRLNTCNTEVDLLKDKWAELNEVLKVRAILMERFSFYIGMEITFHM